MVARTDVDYLAPVAHRPEPYDVRSWIGHLGSRSFTIRAEVRDGDRVLARARRGDGDLRQCETQRDGPRR